MLNDTTFFNFGRMASARKKMYKKSFIQSAISVLNSRVLSMLALWVLRLSFTHPVNVIVLVCVEQAFMHTETGGCPQS